MHAHVPAFFSSILCLLDSSKNKPKLYLLLFHCNNFSVLMNVPQCIHPRKIYGHFTVDRCLVDLLLSKFCFDRTFLNMSPHTKMLVLSLGIYPGVRLLYDEV